MIDSPAAASWKVPTRLDAVGYRLRVGGHVLLRGLKDLLAARIERHRPTPGLAGARVLAERRSPLWTDGRADEFPLVAGKVENLRVARLAFDGVVVPAGAVFSFWRQLGRPTRWRGFVKGREIRAGCVVPVIAGGLCQLSNALATCASASGMTLLERHGHTARIEAGSTDPGELVDATVSWNYVDLRIVAPFDWRLEVELSGDELVVRMRASHALRPDAAATARAFPLVADQAAPQPARGCLTCDETRCYRHPGGVAPPTTGTTAVLVNARTPEFADYLRERGGEAAWFVPWLRPARRAAGGWTPPWAPPSARCSVELWASLGRTWLLKRQAGEGGGRQAALMRGDRWIAAAYARRLAPRHTHLVIDQSLLLPLARLGALHGRTYDVLVHALPACEIQRRLDLAAQRSPGAASLTDFRVAASHWCEDEGRALRNARRLVTPHADVALHLRETLNVAVDRLEWAAPGRHRERTNARTPSAVPLLAFPASALARKGALEMAEALRCLGWRLLVIGTPASDAGLWRGIEVEHVGARDLGWLERADVAALPAHVEHCPRALLLALAHGLPIVASPACGLGVSPAVHEVPAGDVPALIAALKNALVR